VTGVAAPGGPAAQAPRRVLAALALAYALLIVWLSSRPNPLPFLDPAWLSHDKLLHGAGYALLGALVAGALRRPGLRPAWVVLAATLLVAAFGASDELHQWFVPGRSCDVRDWAADVAGALAGAALAVVSLRPRGSRASIGAGCPSSDLTAPPRPGSIPPSS
jgi:VanZ family protein